MSRVLVISPHPDDESIGCGGTLRKHALDGDEVRGIFLTSGEQGGHGLPPRATAKLRETEARKAAAILGLKKVEFWREPDGALQVKPALVKRLRSFLKEWKPEWIYVTHEQESHSDHSAACLLVKRALKGLVGKKYKPEVCLFEIWTPVSRIDHIVDITSCIATKIAAIRAYQSQCRVLRFDDAILGLNRYRGEMHSWPGGDYAEVFTHLFPT